MKRRVPTRRQLQWTTALVFPLLLLAVSFSAAGAQDAKAVALEVAPGELGAFRAEGMVPMTRSEDGEELIFMPQQEGRVHIFEESGDRSGEPLEVRDERLRPFSQKSPSFMAVDGNVLALVGLRNSYLFDLRIGETEAHSSNLPFSADVEATKFGWAVALQSMPMGAAKIYGRGQFEDDIPRVVLLDDDLEVKRTGLLEEELPESGSIGAARRLSLVWDGDSRLYAAEVANYRIYALDKDLDLRATYRDPELTLEEGLDLRSEEEKSAIEAKLAEAAERQGQDLARSGGGGRVMVAEAFDYEPVIQDIAWDSRQHVLLVLVSAAVRPGRCRARLPLVSQPERKEPSLPSEAVTTAGQRPTADPARSVAVRRGRGGVVLRSRSSREGGGLRASHQRWRDGNQ